MQRIPVNMLREGMVVARPVANDNGIILVNSGAELTSRMIERLQNIGIRKILVRGSPVDMSYVEGKTLAEKISDMEYGLKFSPDNDTMRKFRVLLKAHIIKRDNELTGKAPDPPLDSESHQGGLDTEIDA